MNNNKQSNSIVYRNLVLKTLSESKNYLNYKVNDKKY